MASSLTVSTHGVCRLYSVAEPRLLWERVEKLVPRPTSNSGSGGSSSSSSSSNSSSQPGSHCGSGERFRARCESTHTVTSQHSHTCRWTKKTTCRDVETISAKEQRTLTFNSFIRILTFSPPPSASSKSEGSPLQRPENAGKKPEERRDLVRPSRPAVRFDPRLTSRFCSSVAGWI